MEPSSTHNQCPRCLVEHDDLGTFPLHSPLRDINKVREALAIFEEAPADFAKACAEVRIKPIIHPYWEDLPYANIFQSIPPDPLHQINSGLLKHMLSWLKNLYDNDELDARARCMPPNHHTRNFSKGITSLSRLTGKEYNQIAKFMLGLVLGLPLPGGRQQSVRLTECVQGLLDFCYFAEYPVHSSTTLASMQTALERFHTHKDVFIELGIRQHFNLPKLHYAQHYGELIEWLGTADNFDTEYTERLHIDYAKEAYRATNRKDEFIQMTIWLERKEKVIKHDSYIQWCLAGCPPLLAITTLPTSSIHMTVHPTRKAVPLDNIETDYHAPFIRDAIARFIARFNNPDASHQNIEYEAEDIDLPVSSLPVYHKARLWMGSKQHYRLLADEYDIIHAQPKRANRRNRAIPGRFDTVLVNLGYGGYTGLQGM